MLVIIVSNVVVVHFNLFCENKANQ